MAGAIMSAAATVGSTVVITRAFSKTEAGAFFTASSIFLIAETAAGLGAFTGLVYFIARLRTLGEEGRIATILRAAYLPVLFVSVAAAGALVVFAVPLAHLLAGHAGHESAANSAMVVRLLRLLALSLPFATLLDTTLGATRGYRAMRPTVIVDRLGRSTGQLAGVAIAAILGSTALLAPLWALPYIPASAAAWVILSRLRGKGGRFGGRWDPQREAAKFATIPMPRIRMLRDGRRAGGRTADRSLASATSWGFWRFTAPRALASIAQISIQRVDIVLVAILLGPAEAAVYTAATRFLVAGQLFNSAISMASQPRLTELFALKDRPGVNQLYRVTTGWLVLLAWPLYLLSMAYGREVLSIFGHSYSSGGQVMVILGATMLLASACGQVDVVLVTAGRSTWSLANGLLAAVLNVGLDLYLIPRQGIVGAAIGWAAAIAATNLIPLVQIGAGFRLHPFGKGTLTACALTAACFGGIPLVARIELGSATWVSLAAGGTALVLTLAGAWALRGVLRLPSPRQVIAERRAKAARKANRTRQRKLLQQQDGWAAQPPPVAWQAPVPRPRPGASGGQSGPGHPQSRADLP